MVKWLGIKFLVVLVGKTHVYLKNYGLRRSHIVPIDQVQLHAEVDKDGRLTRIFYAGIWYEIEDNPKEGTNDKNTE